MDEISKKRVRWHTRRGLLELDLLLQRFMAEKMDQLDTQALSAFYELLLLPDVTLLDLCHGKTQINDVRLQQIIMLIRQA